MPRYTQPIRTWQYSNEFKVKAVELSHLEEVKVQDVARTLLLAFGGSLKGSNPVGDSAGQAF